MGESTIVNEEYDLSASIVLYHTPQLMFEKVVESFFMNNRLKTELYVVDNSPEKNGDYEKFLSHYDYVTYFYLGTNIGYGCGHNYAIRNRKHLSKYHVILNPDVYFDGEIINEIFSYMENNPKTGLLMPKVLYPDGRTQYLCKMLPSPIMWLSRLLLQKGYLKKKMNYKFEFRFTDYNTIIRVPYLSGCFMFIRDEVFKTVGYFDERIFLHTEDTDYSRRIFEKYDNIYYPKVHIYHHFQRGSYNSLKVLSVHVRSTVYYFNKWGWIFDKKRRIMNKLTYSEYINKSI